MSRPAINAVERQGDCVDEAADARHLASREDDEDAEDRNHVHEDAGDPAPQDRERHVLLRVLHLLGGAVLELEADVVEEQHRHETEEDGPCRGQLRGLEA